MSHGAAAVTPDDEPALIDACLARGQEMLLRKEISTEAALSKSLFATALRLARHRRLLAEDDSGIGNRRAEFAAEVNEALAAVNQLQRIYDRALYEPESGLAIDKRSIA